MNKVAHLETVTLETKLATSKQLNADEILANGEDVAEMFNREDTYREMETRVKLQPEDNYILYADDGTVITANLDGVTNASNLFCGAKIDKISQKTIDDWKMSKIQNAGHLFDAAKITEFEGNFPVVTDMGYAFTSCSNLTKVKIDFPKVISLSSIFYKCSSLSSFEGNLDTIITGNNAFWGTALETFNIPLPSMTTPHWMFDDAKKLKSFSSYMPMVSNAQAMFAACTSLSSFTSKIKRDEDEYSPLSNGIDMFLQCKLDGASVENILTQIQPFEDGSSHILTLGISAEAVPILNEITGNTLPLSSANTDISYKGWTLKVAVNDLPSNYRVVDYLESTGTQYINSGVELTNDSVVTSRFRVLNGHTYGFIFGARYAVNVRAFCLYLDAAYTWLNYDSQSDKTSCPLLRKNIDYDFRAQANVWTFNNEVYTLNPASAFNAGSCFIFNMNVNGVADTRFFVGRVYSFAISNGSDKHKFVPCIDNLGNPCMYDTVTKETFRNEGSGQFIVPTETTTYALRQPQAVYAQLTKHGICRLYHVPEGYEGSEEDYAQEFGFKQLVENERPEEVEEGYYWHPRWKETETEVILYWTKEKKEEEMTDV